MSNQLNVPTHDLRPNSFNPNFVSPENEAKLVESVRKFGLFKPIIVRTKPEIDGYEILGGQHRWEAAQTVGLSEVPIFNLGNIDDDTAKRIALTDNARYGTDDTIELARILEEIGSSEEIQAFLPYTEADVNAIFATTNIALDELDLAESYDDLDEEGDKTPEPRPERAPKTHVIMRFKVAIADSERVTELIAKIQKRQGFTASDDLTNAGDALVHQLFNAIEA